MKMNVLLLAVASVMSSVLSTQATFNVLLELQGGKCSDQLTLICRHSEAGTAPLWIHNRTFEGGSTLGDAFPGAVYTVLTRTEHTTTITGVDSVQALDGYLIECVYEDLGNLIKSNAVKYSFIPPDYQPALSLMSFTPDFSERLSTFTYSFNESCSLYPRCTQYFSVEHTVSPQSPVSNSSSGCSVEYTIRNLMRCVSYQSTATALLPKQRGIPVIVGDTVMLSPSPFTITSVSIGVDRDLINVTYMKNESDCPGYPTERFTVDIDGVQVADLTADAVQSLAINHTNGSVTLSLPLSQPLPENAVTLNMTKFNTVPTNSSDVTGNIVTEMVAWGTSAVFKLSQESSAAMNDEGEQLAIGVVVGPIISVTTIVVVITIAVASVIARRQKAKGTNEHPVESEAVSEGEAPLSVAATGVEGSNTLTEENVLLDEVVEPPPPSPAAETVDETLEVCEPEREYNLVTESTKPTTDEGEDGCKRIRRQPNVDLTRGYPAGGVVLQKAICAFRDDPSTGLDYISGDKDILV